MIQSSRRGLLPCFSLIVTIVVVHTLNLDICVSLHNNFKMLKIKQDTI